MFRYSGVGWRVAKSIETFGNQIMAMRGHTNSYPVDGTLGDADHSSRLSDHNPDANGIVRAIDFYEWETGIANEIFESIRLARDPRCKYAIHDRAMFASYVNSAGLPAWEWRSYTGPNPHITHGHLSVVADARADQPHPWPIGEEMVDRNTKADDGLAVLKPNFDEMVTAGVLSPTTQPGGVAFNDEFATFLVRFEDYLKQKYGLAGDGTSLTEARVRQLSAEEIMRRLTNG